MMRFWPASDRAQLDYERLREMALAGTSLLKRLVKQVASRDYRSAELSGTLGAWPHEVRVRGSGQVRPTGSASRGAT